MSDNDCVYIAAAANDKYAPYLAVMIRSVMEYASLDHTYKFVVLHTDITEDNRTRTTHMVKEKSNFDIQFIDVREKMKNHMNLFISNHIKIETYFRLLLPALLPEVEKILYIDCDVIANSDVYDLYNVKLGTNYLAGTRDADSAANYNTVEDYRNYIDNEIELSNPYDYLQAGIIVMNLSKFRESCNTDTLLATAMSKNWRFHDQDVLNYLCKGNIVFVDYKWNFVYDYDETFRRSKNVIVNAPHYIMSAYMEAKMAPKMIHFSWVNKPWFSPGVHFGHKYWKIARCTPFYGEMLFRMESDLGEYILNTAR